MIAAVTALSWGQLIFMASVFLTALLELKTREVRLWTLYVLPSLFLGFTSYNWAVHNTFDSFSWHVQGIIILLTVYVIGCIFGRGMYQGTPIINLQNKTVTVSGSVIPLAFIAVACAMTVIWEYCTVIYPDMAFCRVLLDFNLWFFTGQLMGRASFYRSCYAKREKAVQVFGN